MAIKHIHMHLKRRRVNKNVTCNISSKGKNQRMEGMLDRKERRQDLRFDHWPVAAPEYGHGSTTSEECGFKYLLCSCPLLSDPHSWTNNSQKTFAFIYKASFLTNK